MNINYSEMTDAEMKQQVADDVINLAREIYLRQKYMMASMAIAEAELFIVEAWKYKAEATQ